MIKPLKIAFDKEKSIEVEKGYIVDNYLSRDNNIGYSIVRTHLNGNHPYMKNINSNRTYYFIKGFATFVIEDEIINISTGEMLVIPKNTKYAFKGKFTAILVDCPAFNPDDDIVYNEVLKDD